MKKYTKRALPVDQVRRYLEPGPIVLVSSAHRGRQNIMTLGWHTILGFLPSLVGCYIWDQNHSHAMIRRSRECVINVPTFDLLDQVIGIGNCHGGGIGKGGIDKFAEFGLTAAPAARVAAPLIAECYANFECRLIDASLIARYSLFIFEVVYAQVATSPRWPRTVHYRGDGVFMLSGPSRSYRRRFRPENL